MAGHGDLLEGARTKVRAAIISSLSHGGLTSATRKSLHVRDLAGEPRLDFDRKRGIGAANYRKGNQGGLCSP
jgi:hypothetical protein